MANKKVSQLTSKPSVLTTDLFPIADPSTGQLYKTTISDLGTAIGSGVSSVNTLVGAVVLDTDDIQELASPTNKWFTDTRARAALSASSPLTYNSGTGAFGIQVATGSQNGYLSSTDWTTFNTKQTALSGTGFVKISGTTISYDNSTYLTTSAAASTYLALAGGTMTGNLLLPDNGTIGGTNYYIGQTMSNGTDYWRIYGNSVAYDQNEMVFQLGDNGTSWSPIGQRFRFYTDNSSGGGTEKNLLTIDYDTASFTTNASFTFSNTSGIIDNNAFIRLVNTGASTLNQSIDLVMRWQDGTYNGTGGISMVRESATARSGKLILQPIDSSGSNVSALIIASTGAATFSSSVMATLMGIGISSLSSWGSTFKVSEYPYGSYVGGTTTGGTVLGNNNYYNGTNYIYKNTDYATQYSMSGGNHTFRVASSGTAGNVITWTPAMTILSGGNVGIGTATPSYGLDIQSASSSGAYLNITKIGYTSAFIQPYNDIVYMGAFSNHPLVLSTNNLERVRITTGGYLKASNDGTYLGISESNHEIRNSNGSSDALRVVGSSASQLADILQIRAARNTTNNTFYPITYYNDGASAYRFRVADSGNVTNSNNSYGAISDIKLKENISDATSKLSDLLKIKVKNYNYIGSDEKQLGVIAQDVEEVFPGLIELHNDRGVNGNDLGTVTKSVKYSVFVPMLIKAVQELKAELDTLKNK